MCQKLALSVKMYKLCTLNVQINFLSVLLDVLAKPKTNWWIIKYIIYISLKQETLAVHVSYALSFPQYAFSTLAWFVFFG